MEIVVGKSGSLRRRKNRQEGKEREDGASKKRTEHGYRFCDAARRL